MPSLRMKFALVLLAACIGGALLYLWPSWWLGLIVIALLFILHGIGDDYILQSYRNNDR